MTATARIARAAKSIDNADARRDVKARISFGLAVKARRKELQLSQQELGNLMDVSMQQVCNIEAGLNWPAIPAYQKLCHALRVGYLPLMKV